MATMNESAAQAVLERRPWLNEKNGASIWHNGFLLLLLPVSTEIKIFSGNVALPQDPGVPLCSATISILLFREIRKEEVPSGLAQAVHRHDHFYGPDKIGTKTVLAAQAGYSPSLARLPGFR